MTTYPVHTICHAAELQYCPLFQVEHFQWTCRERPQAMGRLAYLLDEGFLLHMECYERNPRRVYTEPQSPVCKDSAMEAFFAFTPGQPQADSMYLNLEINANGAMLAKYGAGRKKRQCFSEEEYAACHVRAKIFADHWQIDLLLPLPLLTKLYGLTCFAPGNSFYCNFYKISESPDIEHYAAYSPIDSETPNFHIPVCFGKAVLT